MYITSMLCGTTKKGGRAKRRITDDVKTGGGGGDSRMQKASTPELSFILFLDLGFLEHIDMAMEFLRVLGLDY